MGAVHERPHLIEPAARLDPREFERAIRSAKSVQLFVRLSTTSNHRAVGCFVEAGRDDLLKSLSAQRIVSAAASWSYGVLWIHDVLVHHDQELRALGSSSTIPRAPEAPALPDESAVSSTPDASGPVASSPPIPSAAPEPELPTPTDADTVLGSGDEGLLDAAAPGHSADTAQLPDARGRSMSDPHRSNAPAPVRAACESCSMVVELENVRPWAWLEAPFNALGECPFCHTSLTAVVEAFGG